jgi:hypothetical protein
MKMSDSKSENSLDFATRVQDHLNHYIDVADRKASILLTGHLTFLGLYANLVNPMFSSPTMLEYIMVVLTALSSVVAGGFALSVVYPRTPETSQGLMLWASIRSRSEAQYRDELKDLDRESILDELIDENHALAGVADRKYRHFKISSGATVIMVVIAVLSYAVILT